MVGAALADFGSVTLVDAGAVDWTLVDTGSVGAVSLADTGSSRGAVGAALTAGSGVVGSALRALVGCGCSLATLLGAVVDWVDSGAVVGSVGAEVVCVVWAADSSSAGVGCVSAGAGVVGWAASLVGLVGWALAADTGVVGALVAADSSCFFFL